MPYDSHLYQILAPNPGLVASQLDPEAFAKHYTAGSVRYYAGKVVFAEIDLDYRHPYFKIDEALAGLQPHPDGRPKATKFISTYRVLEHIDLEAIQRLFLSTPEGYTLGLDPAPYDKTHEAGFLRIYADIAPLRMLVMSRLDFPAFGKYITDPGFPKGAPKQFYTQIELDIEHFLEEFEERPTMHPPIPGLHPSNLRAAIMELRAEPDKLTKGLRLDSAFETMPYKVIRHGFMFASQETTRFFPMPSSEQIEATNYRFWRAM
ncbi:hypothetical protein [Halochromatium salexigens]|jgi:hypothetical protein|uniref:Uncharacterized protein n=1 Tax=Halochromatium salexigens TaxID=49447 RepID=A0AAJ0XGW2_HALSE|nr:hypothetical protein [Halochromatium salexigens]MBK5931052.1 hypothetical protein [Halochromatium salexigens]